MIREITNTFCHLFRNTTLDPLLVKFILEESVEKESSGMAQAYAMYRAKLKDLYKEAQKLLQKDVRTAVDIQDKFMTLPYKDLVLVGNSRSVKHNLTIGGGNSNQIYNSGGVLVNSDSVVNGSNGSTGIMVPAFPMIPAGRKLGDMNAQCLRQWTRAVVGRLYGLPPMDDSVIHWVLGLVLRVVLSDASPEVKASYAIWV